MFTVGQKKVGAARKTDANKL